MTGNYVRPPDAEVEGLLVLLDGMSGGDGGNAIVASEKRGQQQLVASAVIPTQMGDRTEYEAIGFTFGEPVEGDPIFTECTLPDDWSKQAGDHDMWSYIVDQYGRRRVSVFYKAAFYDRSAHCNLNTPYNYLRDVLDGGSDPVFDDNWCTPAVAVEELDAMAAGNEAKVVDYRQFVARQPDDGYWPGRIVEIEAETVRIRALRERIAAGLDKP